MLFVLAGTHDEGERRRVSGVICRFGKTVINMTNGALCVPLTACATDMVLTNQQRPLAVSASACLLSPHVDIISHVDSGYRCGEICLFALFLTVR